MTTDQIGSEITPEARTILRVAGSDRLEFLQGLVTNDVARLGPAPLYAALLTPQGKLIADFFLVGRDDDVLLDVPASAAPALFQRLTLYRLRADVAIDAADLPVAYGLGDPPDGAYRDPRAARFGWRTYGKDDGSPDPAAWAAARVRHLIPEWGFELAPDAYILEAGFERLSGVDFHKGCYVGQEVTARMKHKTALRKGFATVMVDGAAPVGTPIEADGRVVGTLYTQAEGRGIAWLRFDRAVGEMRAGDAVVRREEPAMTTSSS